MRKIILCLVAISLFSASSAFAQTGGKIVGKVTDKETNEPLIGCTIYIQSLRLGNVTNENGEYTILNIPPGTYDLSASMVGYKTEIITGIKMSSGLTNRINFTLSTQVVGVKQVDVTAYRIPPVQKDLTSKIQSRSAEELSQTNMTSLVDAITQQAGVLKEINRPIADLPSYGQFANLPTDGLHFRGGRTNEGAYYLDGINVRDQLFGDYNTGQLGELFASSLETFTGTFAPQYGEAMSGVVRVSTADEINLIPKFALKAYTDKHGIKQASDNTTSMEMSLSAALPFYDKLGFLYSHRTYNTDGYIYGYIYPNFVNSNGTDKTGTPKKVPMQYSDEQFDFGKILWKPVETLKLTLGGYLAKSNGGGMYNHMFKYNPYGSPTIRKLDNLGYAKLNYLLTQNSYIDVSVANYERKFKNRVFDNLAAYEVIPQILAGEWSIAGEDYVYWSSFFGRKEVKADYVWQVTKIHSLSAGGGFEQLKTELTRINPEGGTDLERYSFKPYQFNAYVNDKMEFEDMGMIINLGGRFDFINPNRKVLSDVRDYNNLNSPMVNAPTVAYFSPRLGISFPVAEKAAIRFGYGHYYQYPKYFDIFQGTFRYDKTGEYRPNPNVDNTPIATKDFKPEKRVNYEFGLQTVLTPLVSLDASIFYSKTSNLSGVVTAMSNEGIKFSELGNVEYATFQGLELSLKKQFSDNWSAFFNYTLSKSLISTSLLYSTQTDQSRTFPANWDQPNMFSGNLYYESSFGLGFIISGYYASGTPYTRTQFAPNGERGPSTSNIDMNIFQNFTFLGFKQQFFVQILNVTNRANVWWVYADSGIAGSDANAATSFDWTNNPSMYGPTRKIQIGIKIWN